MKIAVFLPNWVGDVVMATPALRALRQHFASAHIVGVVKPYVADILEGAPYLDSQIYLDACGPWAHRWFAAAAQLRAERVDLAVLLPNSFHAALVAWLGRCRRRIGYNRYHRGLLLTDKLEPLWDEQGRPLPSPIIRAYSVLAEAAGCPTPSHRMELFTVLRDEAAADAIWRQTNLSACREVVCLNPGAAFGARSSGRRTTSSSWRRRWPTGATAAC